MQTVLLVLIPSVQSISNKCIVSSKHLSSFVIIISAVRESFLCISRKFGAILMSSTMKCFAFILCK